MKKEKLISLCDYWENQAKKRFAAAEKESFVSGKRCLEHGAVIYFNVAQELRSAIHSKFNPGHPLPL